jgi:hypothetical protein
MSAILPIPSFYSEDRVSETNIEVELELIIFLVAIWLIILLFFNILYYYTISTSKKMPLNTL